MILPIDNNRLRELVPGVIHEAEGENTLYDKILPWLNSASEWIEDNFIGTKFELPASFNELVEKIIVNKAFSEAIPSLDVVLSPAGFAVISTDGRAPASKERIERLVYSLNSAVDSNTTRLISRLHLLPEWKKSKIGQWWSATLLPDLSYVTRVPRVGSLLDTYRTMRSHALMFERSLAEDYIGPSILEFLREEQSDESSYGAIISMIRETELRYISSRMTQDSASGPGTNPCLAEIVTWNQMRPIIDRILRCPSLKGVWFSEIGQSHYVHEFRNDVKGGYFF